MRQTIAHGKEIDVATPSEVAELISAQFARRRPEQYRREKGIIDLDANGNGSTHHGIVVSSQYDLLLERITFGGNGLLAATTIGVYENQVMDTDLLEWVVIGPSLKYSDSFSNCIYVTANSAIMIAVTGGTANLQVTFNAQGRLIPAS